MESKWDDINSKSIRAYLWYSAEIIFSIQMKNTNVLLRWHGISVMCQYTIWSNFGKTGTSSFKKIQKILARKY